jgi:hypothetical protein
MGGVLFETLVVYVKGIVTCGDSVAALMIGVTRVYKLHVLLVSRSFSSHRSHA